MSRAKNFNIDNKALLAVVAEARERTRAIAEEILHDAEMHAPVDTGHLKQSGYIEDDGRTIRVGFSADYARYVEFGTSRMRAQPFLTPAALKRRG